MKAEPVRSDVAAKASAAVSAAAGTTAGLKSAAVTVKGRDVSVSGETLASAGAAKALAIWQSGKQQAQTTSGFSSSSTN